MCHGYSMFVCYHALAVFVVFSLHRPVFMLSGVMRSPNVVSSLFGYFRVSISTFLHASFTDSRFVPHLHNDYLSYIMYSVGHSVLD